jgi:3-oxoacyl-[acyl-carrier protein] reductase
MLLDLEDKVVVVTGAGRGIGRAIAEAFVRERSVVVASDVSAEALAWFGPALAETDSEGNPAVCDVSDTASVTSMITGAADRYGRIDVLVNNAGISHVGAIETTPDDVWRELIDVNLLGTVRMLRAVLPVMRANGSGTIVNVSSANGRVPPAFGGPYSATKFAVEGLSESLLFEVEPFGIRVVVVEPGQFDTAIFGKMAADADARHDPASPYAERETALLRSSMPVAGGAPDPAIAADVIVAAAKGERAGFRHPAGADAERILGARAGMDDDAWLQVVREFLAQQS